MMPAPKHTGSQGASRAASASARNARLSCSPAACHRSPMSVPISGRRRPPMATARPPARGLSLSFAIGAPALLGACSLGYAALPLRIEHEIAANGNGLARLRQQKLEHHVRSVQKFELHRRQVIFPHAGEALVVDLDRLGPVFGEALAPVANGVIIMQAQDLDIRDP